MFLFCGYKKVRSPDVVQLQLSDLGDVNACREINSEELKIDAHTRASSYRCIEDTSHIHTHKMIGFLFVWSKSKTSNFPVKAVQALKHILCVQNV